MTKNERTALALIALGAASRLLPLPPNVTAVTGVTVFGAYSIKNPFLAALVPIGAMALADLFLGWHATMIYTYAGMLGAFLIARLLLAEKLTSIRLIAATFLGSLCFFITTNAGVFASGYYGYTLEGLIACFIAAIPFWQNSLIGDILSVAVIFTIYELRKETTLPQVVGSRA